MPCGLLNLAAFWSRFDGMGPNFRRVDFELNNSIPIQGTGSDTHFKHLKLGKNGKSRHQNSGP